MIMKLIKEYNQNGIEHKVYEMPLTKGAIKGGWDRVIFIESVCDMGSFKYHSKKWKYRCNDHDISHTYRSTQERVSTDFTLF